MKSSPGSWHCVKRVAACILALLVFAPAAAQLPRLDSYSEPPEVAIEAAKLDGTPFELDSAATQQAVAAFSEAVSGERIHDCVFGITTDVPYLYKVMGTPTQQLFLERYANVFGELGLPTALQRFEEGGPGIGVTIPTGGTNILGVLPGRDTSKWVVLGGHYDTRELTVGGGALDNVSGICTVLEIARQAKSFVDAGGQLEASLVFAWYDGEEWGLYGAVAFAADTSVAKSLLGLPADAEVDILVSQSYDMPGLNWPAKDVWPQYGETADLDEPAALNLRTAPIHADEEWACFSQGCYNELKGRLDFDALLRNFTNYQFLVREAAYDLYGCPPEYCWVYDDYYGRSDHIPLIGLGAAGNRIQGAHDEQYPHYHQPTDTLPALYQLAGSQELLTAGYDTEASIGGAVAFYVALTGSVGAYGYVFDPALLPVTLGKDDVPSKGTPLPALALAAVALAAIVARRKP